MRAKKNKKNLSPNLPIFITAKKIVLCNPASSAPLVVNHCLRLLPGERISRDIRPHPQDDLKKRATNKQEKKRRENSGERGKRGRREREKFRKRKPFIAVVSTLWGERRRNRPLIH